MPAITAIATVATTDQLENRLFERGLVENRLWRNQLQSKYLQNRYLRQPASCQSAWELAA